MPSKKKLWVLNFHFEILRIISIFRILKNVIMNFSRKTKCFSSLFYLNIESILRNAWL